MRKVVIFNDRGEMFECDYIDKCNPSDYNFINRYFVSKGRIIFLPLVETMIEYLKINEYSEEDIQRLREINDDYRVHLIYNSTLDYSNNDEWKNNNFLSNIFGVEIFAENITFFISEDDINGFKEVDEKEYKKFIENVLDIINCLREIINFDYFKSVSYIIDSESFIEIKDKKELKELKNKYDSGEYSLFTNAQEVNDNIILLRRNGIIMLVDKDNNSEVYFEPSRSKIGDEVKINYIEKIN